MTPLVLILGPAGAGRHALARELAAHAWLTSGTLFVTGGHNHAQFTVISAFSSEGSR